MLREDILKLFEQNKGTALNGNELAEKLNVSRTAIWKVVNNLRDDGYDIESVHKTGYILNTNSDILSEIKIKNGLSCSPKIIVKNKIDSTMKVATQMINKESFAIITSDEQSCGIANFGKTFFSPKDKGVYLSIIKSVDLSLEKIKYQVENYVSLISEYLCKLTSKKLTIESGAIYFDNKKLCGVKCEMMLSCFDEIVSVVILGIGINIYESEDFVNGKEESKQRISLFEITNQYFNRSEIISNLTNIFNSVFC